MKVTNIQVTKKGTEFKSICLNKIDPDHVEFKREVSMVDYDSLTAAEKTKFDELIYMLESKAV